MTEQQHNRDRCAEQDAVQRARSEHAEERRSGHREFSPAESPDMPERRDVDEAHDGGEDDGRQNRLGQVPEQPDAKSTTTSVKSAATRPEMRRARAGRFVDQRLRHAAAHWQSPAEAREQVGGAQREEFLVGVEPIAVLLREHPADGGRFDGREDEARHRQRQQRDSARARLTSGRPSERQALGHDRRAARRRALRGSRSAPRAMPPSTTKNATGRFFSHSLPAMQQREGADADQQRHAVRLAQVPHEIRRALPEIAMRSA